MRFSIEVYDVIYTLLNEELMHLSSHAKGNRMQIKVLFPLFGIFIALAYR